MFIRALINGSERTRGPFHKWFDDPKNSSITWPIYLFLSTYLPIITQMSSLAFGFLRRRQEASMLALMESDYEETARRHSSINEYARISDFPIDRSLAENVSVFDPPIENYRKIYK